MIGAENVVASLGFVQCWSTYPWAPSTLSQRTLAYVGFGFFMGCRFVGTTARGFAWRCSTSTLKPCTACFDPSPKDLIDVSTMFLRTFQRRTSAGSAVSARRSASRAFAFAWLLVSRAAIAVAHAFTFVCTSEALAMFVLVLILAIVSLPVETISSGVERSRFAAGLGD